MAEFIRESILTMCAGCRNLRNTSKKRAPICGVDGVDAAEHIRRFEAGICADGVRSGGYAVRIKNAKGFGWGWQTAPTRR